MDVEVSFEPQGAVVRVPAGTTLLEAARKAQLPLASGCGGDTLCARCGLRVLGGAEHLSAETEWEVRVKQRPRPRAAPGLLHHGVGSGGGVRHLLVRSIERRSRA
jgi:ferredoxin